MTQVGLHGFNGHQVHRFLRNHPHARIRAISAAAAAPSGELPPPTEARFCPGLDDLLSDPRIDLVVLCSPRRDQQAADAIRCLEAGKHVYAEKPAALSEPDLDRILAAARRHGLFFHEMAGTTLEQPYRAMGRCVRSGILGEVVQVAIQKSYRNYAGRPQETGVDGGIFLQAGIHAMRLIEQTACLKAVKVLAMETRNPVPDGLPTMAAAMLIRLENGGLGSVHVNYLNPQATEIWGNDEIRIFGTQGLLESNRGGRQTRLLIGDRDMGEIHPTDPGLDYLDCVLNEIRGIGPMPLTLEEELHPLRMLLRAIHDEDAPCEPGGASSLTAP